MELLHDQSENCFSRINRLSVNRSEAYYQNTSPKMLIHSLQMSKTCCRTVPYFIPQSPEKAIHRKRENENFKLEQQFPDTKVDLGSEVGDFLVSTTGDNINLTNQSIEVDKQFENAIQVIQKLNAQEERFGIKQEQAPVDTPVVKYEYVQPDASKKIAEQFLDCENSLSAALSQLVFPEPITHVYNPLIYAADPHKKFIRKYCDSHKRALFVGMNPGPFGMAQTGVKGLIFVLAGWV